jgi:hypothetical protein
MGWTHSPPYFCAYTETIADIANQTPPRDHPDHPLLSTTQCGATPQHEAFHPTAVTLGHTDDNPLSFTDRFLDQ